MEEQRVANAPTRVRFPSARSISGLYREADRLHIVVCSSRVVTFVTPQKVLQDYDAGKVGLGQWGFVPDPFEQCYIEISLGGR